MLVVIRESSRIDLSNMPCTKLAGVGPRVAEKLMRLQIFTVQDVLFHLPYRYQDRTRIYPIKNSVPGEHIVVEGILQNIAIPKGGRTRLLCQLKDPTGRLFLRFFYVNSAQRASLKEGLRLRCYGEIRRGQYGPEIIHPEYKILGEENLIEVEEHLTPIYPATEGLNQLTFRKLTDQALQLLERGALLKDILPKNILEKFSFPTIQDALRYVHRPPPDAPQEIMREKEHITQKRLMFEELLAHRLSLLHLKKRFQTNTAFAVVPDNSLETKFLQRLPFQLTKAQQRVIREIKADLQQGYPMLRLVQGDVGSGKTVIAAVTALHAIANGYQVAMMAPTELLAEQHFKTINNWFLVLDISVVFLSGAMKTAERNETLHRIKNHEAHIIIGTHAVFQKNVSFAKLAFIIVDEQHRFGVAQRASLREKGKYEECYPHQLIMTATPIPRTLAMSVYADLDYSIVDELPPGRTPIVTTIISNGRREEVLRSIQKACATGSQAYWVCTLIEESEVLQCQAAEETAKQMKEIFSGINVGLLHGRMKSDEKEKVMKNFKEGEIKLLVATTVIEVGVDVPNATLMVIENAERLGLAQLHQLRGRVGRGSNNSYCVLMYQAPLSALAKERLAIMRETTDGFKIAQKDLEIRGPGEVLGTRQTGDVSLRIANLIRDNDLLPSVQEAADILTNHYPNLISLLIKRWLRNAIQFGDV